MVAPGVVEGNIVIGMVLVGINALNRMRVSARVSLGVGHEQNISQACVHGDYPFTEGDLLLLDLQLPPHAHRKQHYLAEQTLTQ